MLVRTRAGESARRIPGEDENVATVKGGGGDGSAEEQGLEASSKGLNFGEFGHSASVWGSLLAAKCSEEVLENDGALGFQHAAHRLDAMV